MNSAAIVHAARSISAAAPRFNLRRWDMADLLSDATTESGPAREACATLRRDRPRDIRKSTERARLRVGSQIPRHASTRGSARRGRRAGATPFASEPRNSADEFAELMTTDGTDRVLGTPVRRSVRRRSRWRSSVFGSTWPSRRRATRAIASGRAGRGVPTGVARRSPRGRLGRVSRRVGGRPGPTHGAGRPGGEIDRDSVVLTAPRPRFSVCAFSRT